MEKIEKTGDAIRSPWTNERHVDFLNSMEASFVRTMFGNNGCLPRLDRYVPDMSDSTSNSRMGRPRRYSTSDIVEPKARIAPKTRRSSQDQVVPQLKSRRDDKVDKEA